MAETPVPSASALLAGDAPAAPAAPTSNATTPVPNDYADPASTASTPDPHWADSFESADLKRFARDKNFANAERLTDAYRNLERYHGVPADRLLKLPQTPDDPAWQETYTKLGRPATAEQYELPDLDEGAEIKLMPAFREAAFKMGLSQAQAEQLAGWYGELVGTATEQLGTEGKRAREVELTAQAQALRKAWGESYQEGIVSVTRAVKALQLDGDVDTLVEVLGLPKAFNALRLYGDTLAEHKTLGTVPLGSFENTPQAAGTELTRLVKDPAWVEKALVMGSKEYHQKLNLLKLAKPDWDQPLANT